MEGKQEIFTDRFLAEFERSFAEQYPKELTAHYDLLECLSDKDGEETLLAVAKTGEKVVIKYFEGRRETSSEQVFAQLKNLEYEGIPCFLAYETGDSWEFFVREYIEGLPLTDYVRKHIPDEAEIVRIGIALCKILSCIHGQEMPIIHRDIKPQNVIVREDGSVCLIDFGIARNYNDNKMEDTVYCGTRQYAAPEQYGFGQTGITTDIYALGILLTWLLTGKAEPIRKPHTKLEKILCRCTQFAPDRRFESAKELAKKLGRIKVSEGRKKGFLKGTVVAAAAAVAAFVFLATGFLPGRQEQDVSFKEPLIEEAVRVMLDKERGPISKEDLLGVTELYIMGDEVCSTMDDFYQAFEQWGLAGSIRGEIASVEDLKQMKNLEYVQIGGAHISDISPLKGLSNLRKVEFWFNDIEDLSPLAGKEHLTHIGFNCNPLRDISAISSCPALMSIDFRDTGNYFDASVFEGIDGLSFLDIGGASDAWKYLEGKTIEELKVGGEHDITDASCIAGMERLERLYLYWSQVTDISALAEREDITYLNLEGCNITDLSPLFAMKNLSYVVISTKNKAQMEELMERYGEPAFTVEYGT